LARVSHSSENQAKFATAVGGIDVLDLLPMVKAPTRRVTPRQGRVPGRA
jgi:hypothetical protein